MKAIVPCILAVISFSVSMGQHQPSGAWEFKDDSITHTMIVADDYFSVASHSSEGRNFIGTYGGTLKYAKGNLSGAIEFNSSSKDNVGKPYTFPVTIQGNEMLLTRQGRKELWKKVDDGKGPLAGNWRIASREQNGTMNPMTPGPRKTIKILSGTRFQWAAINTESGEFFGTGGGMYTLIDGKYTEKIAFFSRDNSRVGMSLSFDARVDGREWQHSGKSSRGEPVKEIWLR